MKKIIHPIEELRKICGYYDWDGEAYERYHFIDVCLHPESKSPYYDEGHCMASNCPLGGLAEYQDFKECGYSDEEARDGDNQMDCVFTLLKVLNVLIIILLFTYFLQPFRTDCGIVSDITSARYRLSEKTQNRRLLF